MGLQAADAPEGNDKESGKLYWKSAFVWIIFAFVVHSRFPLNPCPKPSALGLTSSNFMDVAQTPKEDYRALRFIFDYIVRKQVIFGPYLYLW